VYCRAAFSAESPTATGVYGHLPPEHRNEKPGHIHTHAGVCGRRFCSGSGRDAGRQRRQRLALRRTPAGGKQGRPQRRWDGMGAIEVGTNRPPLFSLNARLRARSAPTELSPTRRDAAHLPRTIRDSFRLHPYGANIETSTNPEAVRQYGLEPFGYYLIASRLVRNSADLIVRAFERFRSDRILALRETQTIAAPLWMPSVERKIAGFASSAM